MKFKKIAALSTAVIMSASMLVGCGNNKSKENTDKSFKIGMVADIGGINDESFNQSAWEGLQKAEKDFGIEVKVIESKQASEYLQNMESLLDEDVDMVIGVGYTMKEDIEKQAKNYPDKQFVLIDETYDSIPENVTPILFKENEAAYLTGLVAGKMTENNNVGFIGGAVVETYHYETDVIEAEKLIARLKEKRYTKINIDENCIVGWATEYYRIVPTARKEDFLGDDTGKHKTIGEIRRPHIFADYIYPYNGETNVKFNYLMDRLNDTLQKKNLGAFYTHVLYAKKSAELVREAIKRVPDGNDYIILDRCAGTGNLESALNDEELSHCIVSTIEYYEYKVLQELYGAKVRHIIPPVETSDTFNAGLVTGADALSEEYINNPIIRKYIDDEHCTVILFENPPYVETTSAEHQRNKQAKKSSTWKNSYVVQEMKKEVGGTVSNDLGNAFIWSAFKYYLRKERGF